MFADLSGFTKLSEGLDPEEVKALAHRCAERLGEEVARFGGTVITIAGDQVVAAFGAPVAHEDDAERAVRAALAMRDCRLQDERGGCIQIHAGVNTGEVMAGLIGPQQRQDYAVMGDTTNVAARLMGAALPGSVLVGEETWRATCGVIKYRELPPMQVKGKSRPVLVWEAIEAPSGPGSRPLGTTPLVGRDEELALLSRIWLKLVREGRPHLVTVVGEPGIGKSRLVAEFERRFCADATVLHGRCLPYGEVMSYRAVTMMLKEAANITEETDPGAARAKLSELVKRTFEHGLEETSERNDEAEIVRHLALLSGLDVMEDRVTTPPEARALYASTRRFLEALARQRPLCLILEDIHWADDSLLDLVEYIASRAKEVRLLVLTQARPQLLENRPAWGRGVRAFTSLPVEVLPEASGQELILALCRERGLSEDFAGHVGRGAGGNPLFAEELVAMIAERGSGAGIPSAIKAIISARLDTLPAAQRMTLQLAAVFGKTFWARGLSAIGDGEGVTERLEALAQKDLLRSQLRSQFRGDLEYSFKHDLIVDVAYETLPRAQRRVLHGRIADWIEQTSGGQTESYFDLLAHHNLNAGRPERAMDYLAKAADRGRRAGAHGQSVKLLSQAIQLAEGLGHQEAALAMRHLRGQTCMQMARWAEAKLDFEVTLAGIGDQRCLRRAEVLIDLAHTCHFMLDSSRLRPAAVEALALAEEAGSTELAAEALLMLAQAENVEGRAPLGLPSARRAMERVGGIRCKHNNALPVVALYQLGQYEEAIKLGYECADFDRETQNLLSLLTVIPQTGLALAGLGRYGEAQENFLEARRLAERYEIWSMHARSVALSAGFHLDVFDFAGNEALAEEARELGRSANFPAGVCSSGIDLLVNLARRGEVGRAIELMAEVGPAAEKADRWHGWIWKMRMAEARAEIALAGGLWEEAVLFSDEALMKARSAGRIKYQALALWNRGRALNEAGRRQEGTADLKGALALARQLSDPAMFLRVATSLLAIDGDDSLLGESRATARNIIASLPDEELRCRFAEAEAVRKLGSLGP